MTNTELYELAMKAAEKTYSPYSNFPVGAALLTGDGKVYTGCNIENVSFGATICAERTALVKAVSEGERDFVKIAVAAKRDVSCSPCGICRQCLAEFAPHISVIYKNSHGIVEKELKELLLDAFDL